MKQAIKCCVSVKKKKRKRKRKEKKLRGIERKRARRADWHTDTKNKTPKHAFQYFLSCKVSTVKYEQHEHERAEQSDHRFLVIRASITKTRSQLQKHALIFTHCASKNKESVWSVKRASECEWACMCLCVQFSDFLSLPENRWIGNGIMLLSLNVCA